MWRNNFKGKMRRKRNTYSNSLHKKRRISKVLPVGTNRKIADNNPQPWLLLWCVFYNQPEQALWSAYKSFNKANRCQSRLKMNRIFGRSKQTPTPNLSDCVGNVSSVLLWLSPRTWVQHPDRCLHVRHGCTVDAVCCSRYRWIRGSSQSIRK